MGAANGLAFGAGLLAVVRLHVNRLKLGRSGGLMMQHRWSRAWIHVWEMGDNETTQHGQRLDQSGRVVRGGALDEAACARFTTAVREV